MWDSGSGFAQITVGKVTRPARRPWEWIRMNAQDPTGIDPNSEEGRARDAARREAERRQSLEHQLARSGQVDEGAVDSTGRAIRDPRRGTQLDEDI
jgi:hypothetical protein